MLVFKITDQKEKKQLELEAIPENLSDALNFINNELKLAGMTAEKINEMDIAVEEIFMNITNYAYKPESGNACITVSTSDKILIIFEDSGKPYNPLEQAPPDLEKPLVNRDIGGLGVFLVKKIMDNVKYDRRNGKNILTIMKNRT
jgi:anti-sigma regulatory factor (Ser/Thr protein kinase)